MFSKYPNWGTLKKYTRNALFSRPNHIVHQSTQIPKCQPLFKHLASINLHSANLYSGNYTPQQFTHWSIPLHGLFLCNWCWFVFGLCTPKGVPFELVCRSIPRIPRECGNAYCLEWVWRFLKPQWAYRSGNTHTLPCNMPPDHSLPLHCLYLCTAAIVSALLCMCVDQLYAWDRVIFVWCVDIWAPFV